MARRGSERSSCPACHRSPRIFRTAVAMESLETPVKDGILYQQHVKFGKVGTSGCQPRAERETSAQLDSLSRPERTGKGIWVG